MTTAECIAVLVASYPKERVTETTLGAYIRALDDIDEDLLSAACARLVKTSEWFPTIATIRGIAAEMMTPLPTPEEALRQVQAVVEWGRTRYTETPPRVDPLVDRAVRDLGGYHTFRTTDQPGILTAQFLKLYREMREGRVKEIQSQPMRRALRD